MESINLYLTANGNRAIDNFIRERGGPSQAEVNDSVSHDSNEESEEETLANKGAWQPRTTGTFPAREATTEQQGWGPTIHTELGSTVATQRPGPEGCAKQGDKPTPPPTDGKKRSMAERPRHKAPGILQAMKAAHAAKKAQEALSETQRQDTPQKITSQQVVPQQMIPQQIASQQANPRQPVASSKKRSRDGSDRKPSALEQLKRRRMGGEGQPALPSTATHKVTIVAGRKLMRVVAAEQVASPRTKVSLPQETANTQAGTIKSSDDESKTEVAMGQGAELNEGAISRSNEQSVRSKALRAGL